MTYRRLLFTIFSFCVFVLLSCSKDENPTGPDESTPPVVQYAGVWTGTTGQNQPVYFRITPAGVVDSLTVRIRMSVGLGTCTATFSKDTAVSVQGNSFVARVNFPGASYKTYMRATLGSAASSSGTYDGYYGSFVLLCGTSLSFGTGTMISQGTWTATKTSQ